MPNRTVKRAIHSALDLVNDGLTVEGLANYVGETARVPQKAETVKPKVIKAIRQGLFKEELVKENGKIYKKGQVNQRGVNPPPNKGTLFLVFDKNETLEGKLPGPLRRLTNC